MNLEQRTRRFAEELQRLYFEERDIDSILAVLDQDVILFGFGREEIRFGREDMTAWLLAEKEAFQGSFRILESWYDVLRTGEDACLASGLLQLQQADIIPPFILDVRVFLLCRETAEGMRLSRIHMSLPSSGQEEGEFFPCRLTAESNRLLEKMVREKSAEIEARNRDLQMLTRNIPGGIFRCLYDEKLTILQVSDGFLSLFGYTREELHTLFGDSFLQMIEEQDREPALLETRRQLARGNAKTIEYRVICKDGRRMWVLDKGQLLSGEEATPSFYCVLVDVTQGKEAQENLRLSLERHQIIMDQTNDIILEWDIRRDVLEFSPNWEKKFGYRPLSRAVSERITTDSHIHPEDQQAFVDLLERLRKGNHYAQAEIRLQQQRDGYIWCRIRFTVQKDATGVPVKAVGVIIDIDREKRSTEKLLEQARRDTLTKLYNKGTSEKLIRELLPANGEVSALLIIDMDDFKLVNDSKGHMFGDAFLVETANEIRKRFRQMDVVGRIGGDEFLVFIRAIPSLDLVREKAEQIIAAVRELGGRSDMEGKVSCSIGVAVAPDHGQTFSELYRRADHALYYAKKQGKNRYAIYDGKRMDDVMDGPPQVSQSAVGAAIDSDAKGEMSIHLFEYVFRILYQSKNVEAAVQSILEIAGRQFDVSRAYIFENTEDDRYCSNTFEWCNDGVPPEIDRLQHISYEKDLDGVYLENFNEKGIFYCRDIAALEPKQRDMLESQGIKSVLQCAIWDSGRFRGYVGFDECRSNRFWDKEQVNALQFVSEILSIFLLKYRAQRRLEQSVSAMREVLDNQNAWVYVIRPDTYELLYINRKTMSLAPDGRVGMPCYKAYFHRDTPCGQCPARAARENGGHAVMEMYNPQLQVWSEADASCIRWKGEEAVLLSCHDITQYKENR